MKKRNSNALAFLLCLTAFPFSACTSTATKKQDGVLRVASWDEYIYEGGEEGYGELPLYEEFEIWYKQTTGKTIKVEYIPLQDNETMYNKIKMGDHYDLLCPSEYMMMKLASENRLEKIPASFFDPKIEENYYIRNLSPYIKSVFENGTLEDGSRWSEYIAGYMWGTTGFVFNPEQIDRSAMQNWSILTDKAYNRQITAKDNVRDSYFMGLGLYYETELEKLASRYAQKEITLQEYTATLSEMMNDTSVETMTGVKKELEKMRTNLYGLETDEAKNDIAAGRLSASYQWSGDAVYILDEAEDSEDEENSLELEYCIPDTASNLWFDGWTMMKGADVDASLAFINFLSRPDNVEKNMYYIGYTSCIGGAEVFEYIQDTYSADEDETDVVEYDLRYFFGDNEDYILTTSEDQTRRQLFAQYPDSTTISRLVVMKYFDKKTNERANRMWNNIK